MYIGFSRRVVIAAAVDATRRQLQRAAGFFGCVVGIFEIFARPQRTAYGRLLDCRCTADMMRHAVYAERASVCGMRARTREKKKSEGYPCLGIKQIRDPQCGPGIMCVCTHTHLITPILYTHMVTFPSLPSRRLPPR